MAEPYQEDWLSGNWGQIALPLAAAALSALGPNVARGVHTGLGALTLSQQARELGRRRQEEERFRSSLPGMLSQQVGTGTFREEPTGEQLPQIETDIRDPAVGTYPEMAQKENMRDLFSPEQRAAIPNLPLAQAAQAIGSIVTREPKRPDVFGDAALGFHALDPSGAFRTLVPGVGLRPPTPPRPVYATQGGEAVRSVYNPETQQFEETRTPLTPTPRAEDPLLEEKRTELTTRADVNRARATRLRQIDKAANDPNVTKEKLTTMLSVLIRDKQNTFDEDEIAEIDTIIKDIRGKLAGRVRGEGGGGAMNEMPDPAKARGRTVRDTTTGKRYKSDGSKWVEIQGSSEY